jgi:ABC-type polysaccharide/polyol phosphate transport system ATPase subunit
MWGHDLISQKSGSCPKIPIDGRVASLLEVGTGFHPELSMLAELCNISMDNPGKKR